MKWYKQKRILYDGWNIYLKILMIIERGKKNDDQLKNQILNWNSKILFNSEI